MKTSIQPFVTIITAAFLLSSCHKEESFSEEISQEDLMHYQAMQLGFEMAVAYQDSLELCTDSVIMNCNTTYFDSLYHVHIDSWNNHHSLYSHEDPIDDHHHTNNMEHHEHCEHCSTEGHSLADHDAMNELQQKHQSYHP